MKILNKLIDRRSTVLIKILKSIFGDIQQADYKTYMEIQEKDSQILSEEKNRWRGLLTIKSP